MIIEHASSVEQLPMVAPLVDRYRMVYEANGFLYDTTFVHFGKMFDVEHGAARPS